MSAQNKQMRIRELMRQRKQHQNRIAEIDRVLSRAGGILASYGRIGATTMSRTQRRAA